MRLRTAAPIGSVIRRSGMLAGSACSSGRAEVKLSSSISNGPTELCRERRTVRTFNLFISHSWSYSVQYSRLVSLLNNRKYFSFRDYSVPIDDPIHTTGSDTDLRRAIRRHMAPCSVVLILAGVYATYSRWIKEEIDLAQEGFIEPKPIIAVAPWGSHRISVPVQRAANRVVRWNTDSIVSAIRELV